MGLIFTPDGEFMYSTDSQGSLVLYNAFDEDYNVIRVLCMYANTLNQFLSSDQLYSDQ